MNPLIDLKNNLESRFPDLLNINITESYQTEGYPWLTINSNRASKRKGIQILKDHFGFKNHTLVCFGDQPVDLLMFAEADISVAVANAHPDVKAAADLIIGDHNSDAVIKYIRDDFFLASAN